MSDRNSRPSSRGGKKSQRGNGKPQKSGRGRDEYKKELIIDDIKTDKKEEKKSSFVPWLGEARPKRGAIYDLESKLGSKITIEYLSGRVIEGVLSSYDRSMNLILDDTVELLDGGKTRNLGTIFSCGRVESLGQPETTAV